MKGTGKYFWKKKIVKISKLAVMLQWRKTDWFRWELNKGIETVGIREFFQQSNRGTFHRDVLFSTKALLRNLPQTQDKVSEREACARGVGDDFGERCYSSGDYPGPLWDICVSHSFLHPFFLVVFCFCSSLFLLENIRTGKIWIFWTWILFSSQP